MSNKPLLSRTPFPKSTIADWKRTASAEIEGKDPFEYLAWSAEPGINFLPYYDQSGQDKTGYLEKFIFPPSSADFTDARHWVNMPEIKIDAPDANQRALRHLGEGAEGILISGTGEKKINFADLLENIEWPYCTLSFLVPGGPADLSTLAEYGNTIGYNTAELHGSFFWEGNQDWKNLFLQFRGYKKINLFGIAVPPSNATTEIATALLHGVAVIEQFPDMPPQAIIGRVAFSISVGTDFLLEAAKLKALRMLWFQVARAYEAKNYEPSQLHLHARSPKWIVEKFQPHGNLLKSTLASMAAVAGGCDALTVYPEDENNDMMSRMARNVSVILREESHYSKVADPLAGAYALDAMTDALARNAWGKFSSEVRL